MKKTQRQKNFLFTEFLFHIIVIGGLFSMLFLKILPDYLLVEEKKEDTKVLLNEMKILKNKGISYNQFISLGKKINSEDYKDSELDINYIKKLIDKTDISFFEDSFSNTGSLKYEDFIDEKIASFNENVKINLDLDSDIKKTVDVLLPTYSELLLDDSATLSDYKFINYLESLFRTFNLTYVGDIGINSIVDYDNEIENKNGDLDAGLFYIPLDLSITGRKIDIIDFIYYLENVGYIIENDGKIKLYNDTILRDKSVLSGDKRTINYNIYRHQLTNIDNIKMSSYLDSSNEITQAKSFIDFIKSDIQKDEEFSIDISMRFYVLGAKNYEIEKYVKSVLSNYKSLNKFVDDILADQKKSRDVKDYVFINKIESIKKYLNSIVKDIEYIKASTDVNGVYKKAKVLAPTFETLNEFMENNKDKIEENKVENNKKEELNNKDAG